MIDVYAKTLSQVSVANNTDQIITGVPIPADGVLKNVWLEIHGISAAISVFFAAMYGITGYIVPVLDPDNVVPLDTLWDTQIPKDIELASGAYDLDVGATDSSPEMEWGEVNTETLFQAGVGPKQIFERKGLVTFTSAKLGFETGTPDTFTPSFAIKTQLKQVTRVSVPSVVMFGLSSPTMTDTTTSERSTPSEAQWSQYKYLEMTLEQALLDAIGLTEAGAETPYEEALAFLADIIERDALEDDAGSFAAVAWTTFTKATYQISVPGRFEASSISSG